jgi:hypothetical protein
LSPVKTAKIEGEAAEGYVVIDKGRIIAVQKPDPQLPEAPELIDASGPSAIPAFPANWTRIRTSWARMIALRRRYGGSRRECRRSKHGYRNSKFRIHGRPCAARRGGKRDLFAVNSATSGRRVNSRRHYGFTDVQTSVPMFLAFAVKEHDMWLVDVGKKRRLVRRGVGMMAPLIRGDG